MMQSTIRSELTCLLRTNSSIDSFEQEVKFFRIKWTRRGPRWQRVRSNRPQVTRRQEKHWSEARRKSSRNPVCTKYNIPGVCDISLFEESINKHVKVVQRCLGRECKPIMASTVAPQALEANVQCPRGPHGRRTSQGLNVCFSFCFLVCVNSHQHLSEDFLLQKSYACHLRGSLSVSLLFGRVGRSDPSVCKLEPHLWIHQPSLEI